MAALVLRVAGVLSHTIQRRGRGLALRPRASEVHLTVQPPPQPPDYGSARLDRLVAHATGYSRKDVSRALRKGLVVVDGATERDGARKVALGGAVTVHLDGAPLELRPPPLLLAFHKPLGVHSTMADNHGRADLSGALFDLPPIWLADLHPVGRLDADTSGLLLFSSSGLLTQRLLHPRHGTEKEYIAVVSGEPISDGGAALRETLRAGVRTAEGTHVAELLDVTIMDDEESVAAAEAIATAASEAGLRSAAVAGGSGGTAEAPSRPVASLRLSVTEGKHRMVRRMLANTGHPVEALHRVRFGAVVLDPTAIPPGAWEPVGGETLAWAEALASAAGAGPTDSSSS